MKLLLDTHIFLWFISADTQLPQKVRDATRDSDNEVYLSAISVWEVIVKYQLGKFSLPESPEIYLPKQRDLHQISSLPFNETSVIQLAKLPPLHRDPLDRMLVCQALQHNLTIATVDPIVRAYPVNFI